MIETTHTPQSSRSVNAIVLVAALGYFVDIYDLLLFGIVRVPSLIDLGYAAGSAALTRQGEFLMTQGISYGYYGADFSLLRALAKNDFDRTMNLIDTFSRREIRIALKLQLAESIMN